MHTLIPRMYWLVYLWWKFGLLYAAHLLFQTDIPKHFLCALPVHVLLCMGAYVFVCMYAFVCIPRCMHSHVGMLRCMSMPISSYAFSMLKFVCKMYTCMCVYWLMPWLLLQGVLLLVSSILWMKKNIWAIVRVFGTRLLFLFKKLIHILHKFCLGIL